MNMRYGLFMAFLSFFWFSMAQNLQGQAVNDTLLLEEVRVYGARLEKFAAGNKVLEIDSATLSAYQGSTLSDLLQQQTPIYFKTYGNGMLSSASFRGTSASHTAVLWNGININSASLGQTDFSIIPVFGTDQISIHYGGGSPLFGSDAIGGTINLTSVPTWAEGFKANVQQDVGSFSNYYTSFSAKYGNGKYELRTGIYRRDFENNFPYVNTARFKSPWESQHNASIQQWGIVQDIHYKISSKSYLTINSWWNDSNREIQPTLTNRRSTDRQADRNFKVVGNYHRYKGVGYSNIRLGYLYDLIDFNGSASVIKRFHAAFQHEIKINKQLHVRVGGDWNHIMANVQGHETKVVEDRNDLFLLTRFAPSDRWLISLNLRQPFVSGFQVPFAPSLGAEYEIASGKNRHLSLKANLSKNYRVPTLNDRFWNPGGNADLLPENSINAESGLLYVVEKSGFKSETELTAYQNLVDDWIIWLPGESYWSPDNVKKVKVRGVEVLHKMDYILGRVSIQSGLNYLFSRSITAQSEIQQEIGSQLPYAPIHSGMVYSRFAYSDWFINPRANYTGIRYTTSAEERNLPAYALIDVFLGKNIYWKIHSLSLSLRIKNLANKTYQNYENRAMPGRSYLLSVRYGL